MSASTECVCTLINEVGVFVKQVTTPPAGVSDSRNLAPMYERLHAAIRKYDTDHIIFFEPTVILTEVVCDRERVRERERVWWRLCVRE